MLQYNEPLWKTSVVLPLPLHWRWSCISVEFGFTSQSLSYMHSWCILMAVECLHADERINLVLVLCEIMVELMFLSAGEICGLMPIGPTKLALSPAPHFDGVNW